jgi:hypothetical protein
MPDQTGRRALPPETNQRLGYDELVRTLLLLEGEEVCLCRSFGGGDGRASRFEVVGRFSDLARGTERSVHHFAIGNARLRLCDDDFVEARLWTFDGNDFFQVILRFGDQELVLGDVGSLATEVDIP